MSFRILHIDEDFAAASFQSVYSEHGRLEHLVAVRLNTCNDNGVVRHGNNPQQRF